MSPASASPRSVVLALVEDFEHEPHVPSTKPVSRELIAPAPFRRVHRIPRMKHTAIGGLM